jgi:hypothetical protein
MVKPYLAAGILLRPERQRPTRVAGSFTLIAGKLGRRRLQSNALDRFDFAWEQPGTVVGSYPCSLQTSSDKLDNLRSLFLIGLRLKQLEPSG